MQPSSLIFLVIVAIWVAYLVQHWVRRREHLATARSVDRFSQAMRVLERRNPLPATMLATAGPRGSGESPSRPEVTVKHASAPSAPSPLRARAKADGPLPPAHDVPPIELVPHRTATQLVLRRVRGVLFLAGLVAVPVTLALSAAHILKWLSVWISLGVLVGVTVWLRVAAIRDQAARRARRAAHRQLAQARARVGETSIRERRTLAPTSTDAHTPAVESEPVEALEPVEPALPGGWQPVPVPPPTYTLKEPAHPRPEPNRPVPIEVEDDDLETLAAAPRRMVGS